MNLPLNKSMTLMELIIAIVLLSVVVLSLTSIYLFSRYQVFTADRRTDAQNEASLVLEHMTKNLVQAIGSPAQNPVTLQNAGGAIPAWRRIRVRIDSTPDGVQNVVNDIQVQYQWRRFVGPPLRFEFRYWPDVTGPSQIISRNITACVWSIDWATLGNNIRVDVTACSDPDNNPYPCGTPDNPNVDITTTIKMPSVSAN